MVYTLWGSRSTCERRLVYCQNYANLVLQACISFLTCFRKANLRKCWQFPMSFYRRVSWFGGVSGKSGTLLLLPSSHKSAVAHVVINDMPFGDF